MTSPQDVVEIQGTWISPSRLVAYLERHGWQSRGGQSGLYIRFYHPDDNGGPSKVIVPLNPSMGDFRPLIEDAVVGVATSVGYTLQRLLTELAFRIGDKVRFRKQVPSPHGAIPWRTGESLVTSATKILEAAAKAEREKTAYFGNKHWTSARSYLDEVRMGQTEEGSYVVTAFTPTETLPGHDVPLPLPGFGDAPTGRDVTQTLTTSLEATRHALDEYRRTESIEPFQEAVSYGLSYELARGLVGVVDKSDGADIAVEWEFENAADVEGLVTVEFEPTDIPALERVANRFSQTEPSRNVTVLGMVTLLSRPTVGAAGVVRLEVIEGSQAKKLRVRMPEELYDEAIRAHREGMALQMSGRQEKEGRLYWLYDPTEMLLVEPPVLPDPPTSTADDEDDDYLA